MLTPSASLIAAAQNLLAKFVCDRQDALLDPSEHSFSHGQPGGARGVIAHLFPLLQPPARGKGTQYPPLSLE